MGICSTSPYQHDPETIAKLEGVFTKTAKLRREAKEKFLSEFATLEGPRENRKMRSEMRKELGTQKTEDLIKLCAPWTQTTVIEPKKEHEHELKEVLHPYRELGYGESF